MKIYLVGDDAFVQLERDSNYMICIGKKDDALKADNKTLVDMVEHALVRAQYNSMSTGKERLQ